MFCHKRQEFWQEFSMKAASVAFFSSRDRDSRFAARPREGIETKARIFATVLQQLQPHVASANSESPTREAISGLDAHRSNRIPASESRQQKSLSKTARDRRPDR